MKSGKKPETEAAANYLKLKQVNLFMNLLYYIYFHF